jgi:hypothetical protein
MGKYLFQERRLPVYDIAVAITKYVIVFSFSFYFLLAHYAVHAALYYERNGTVPPLSFSRVKAHTNKRANRGRSITPPSTRFHLELRYYY